MENNLPIHLQEVIYGSSDSNISKQISHLEKRENKKACAPAVFSYKYTRKAALPGITIRFLEGSGPIAEDNPLSGVLSVSALYLKIFSPPESRVLIQIEERLEQIIRVNGEEELNKVRGHARLISEKLNMQKEFIKLNKIISALLTTHKVKILKSPIAAARAFGVPYDPDRLALFETLFIALNQQEFKYREEKNKSSKAFKISHSLKATFPITLKERYLK